MLKQRKTFLLSLLTTIGVSALLMGIVFGNTLLSARKGAHAAGVLPEVRMSINPMEPMKGMAVPMATNGTPAIPCLASTTLPLCYSPQQMRTAYGMQSLIKAGITGKGRIITIIDGFQDPTVRGDLSLFDQLFGLKDPQLNIIAPFGLTPFNPKDPDQTSFAAEIGLDVEWAHAIAPGATIDLILANIKQETAFGEMTALLQATNYAVTNNIGSVISQSFGLGETCIPPAVVKSADKTFQQAAANKQTVFASTGDDGSGVLQCDAQGNPVAIAQGANFPASDPFVTSVGGTTLLAAPNGTYTSETTWNEAQKSEGATGGGVSKLFALPSYQKNLVKSAARVVSDISLDADPESGAPVVTSSLTPGATLILPIGGTSLSAPLAAGMTALFDQAAGGKRLGFLNPALYRLAQSPAAYASAFHDIQTGDNTYVFQDGNGNIVTVPGFKAAAGWDVPTGLGTPNAANMLKLLPLFL